MRSAAPSALPLMPRYPVLLILLTLGLLASAVDVQVDNRADLIAFARQVSTESERTAADVRFAQALVTDAQRDSELFHVQPPPNFPAGDAELVRGMSDSQAQTETEDQTETSDLKMLGKQLAPTPAPSPPPAVLVMGGDPKSEETGDLAGAIPVAVDQASGQFYYSKPPPVVSKVDPTTGIRTTISPPYIPLLDQDALADPSRDPNEVRSDTRKLAERYPDLDDALTALNGSPAPPVAVHVQKGRGLDIDLDNASNVPVQEGVGDNNTVNGGGGGGGESIVGAGSSSGPAAIGSGDAAIEAGALSDGGEPRSVKHFLYLPMDGHTIPGVEGGFAVHLLAPPPLPDSDILSPLAETGGVAQGLAQIEKYGRSILAKQAVVDSYDNWLKQAQTGIGEIERSVRSAQRRRNDVTMRRKRLIEARGALWRQVRGMQISQDIREVAASLSQVEDESDRLSKQEERLSESKTKISKRMQEMKSMMNTLNGKKPEPGDLLASFLQEHHKQEKVEAVDVLGQLRHKVVQRHKHEHKTSKKTVLHD